MTKKYKRNCATTLSAAMSMLDGAAISHCALRHRHIEWLALLRQIDREPQATQNTSSDLQQLRHLQASEMDRQIPAIPRSFHTNLDILAEHGRAFLSRHNDQPHPQRRIPQCHRTGHGHQGLQRDT